MEPAMTSSHTSLPSCHWFSCLAAALDPRSAPRLVRLFLGVLAHGRLTITRWIRATGLSQEFRPCYTTVAAAGKRSDRLAAPLLEVVKPLVASAERLTLAIRRHLGRTLR